MEMEEKEPTLMIEDDKNKSLNGEVCVEFEDAGFSWGYRVKDNQDQEKIKKQRQRIQVENSDQ